MHTDVRKWLEALGLGQYADTFEENDIDGDVLSELDHESLKDLGIGSTGHRLRILKSIKSTTADELPTNEASLSPSALAPQQATPSTGDAERRQLTVMFCDLVGSTALSQDLDPEDLRRVNRAYQDACKEAIERYDGYVARYMGDGVLAYFGYPQAHEDDAERAIYAGLALVDAMKSLNSLPGAMSGSQLSTRVGIGTGPVVVGDLIGEGASQEHAVVGETANLAARLESFAKPDTVLVSPRTRALATGRFAYEDLGEQTFKGLAHPVQIWQVIGIANAGSRFEALHRTGVTPLVGRELEIGLLLERWEQAKGSEGQVVLLSGEAGIGKSRITEALKERTTDDEPFRLQYQCSPYHTNSALFPVIEHLERAADFKSKDSNDEKLEKLESLLSMGTSNSRAVAPLFAPLLSIPSEGRYPSLEMTPEQQKEMTLEALISQIQGLSRSRPALLVFEDTHWADPTSIELLEFIIGRIQTESVFVVITYRPEFVPPWAKHTHVTTLTLNRFPRGLSLDIIANVTAGKSLPEEVQKQIIDRTDGVPLFVEELTKTILESGHLNEESSRYVLSGPLSEVSIPATLHDSLMARLDQMGAVKEVAQFASVIGREFDYDLLAAACSLSVPELRHALKQLLDAELLFRTSRSPNMLYSFKHALVQDAAYESLLRETRREIHRRIAEALESHFPEVVETQPELLGHHYTEAELAEPAIEYWKRAGQRAIERSANVEAIAYLEKAVMWIWKLPESRDRSQRELELQTMIAGPLIATEGYGAEKTGRAFSRAQALSAEVGATAELFPVMYGRWVYNVCFLRHDECIQIGKQFEKLARQQTSTGPILMGHRINGINDFFMGAPNRGMERLRIVMEMHRPAEHSSLRFKYGTDPRAAALVWLSLCLWQLGYPDEARALCHESVEYAEELEHLNTRGYTECFGSSMISHLCWDPIALQRVVESVASLAKEHRLAMWTAMISFVDGYLKSRQHGDRHGIMQMQEALEELDSTLRNLLPYRLSMLADAQMRFGEVDAGLATIEQAIALTESSGERWFEAELHRIKAELVLKKGGHNAAETCLLQSLRIARSQDAKSFELRTTTSLARLWADGAKRGEALALIEPVYNWFTEGFDTPDLKEAKVLLEELA